MASYRVEILHGVNFDMLGARDPHHYGGNTLPELELKIKRFANDLGLEASTSSGCTAFPRRPTRRS